MCRMLCPAPRLENEGRSGWVERLDVVWEEPLVWVTGRCGSDRNLESWLSFHQACPDYAGTLSMILDNQLVNSFPRKTMALVFSIPKLPAVFFCRDETSDSFLHLSNQATLPCLL